MKDFSFIIVTYNNEDTITYCLSSIIEKTEGDYEIIIVDNSENDLTTQKIKDFPVKLIKPEKNIGFAQGCNLGFRNSNGEYLIFLNPDAVLINDVANILRKFYETKSNYAVVGAQIINPLTGKIEKTCRNLPDFFNTFLECVGLDRFFSFYTLNNFSHKFTREVPQVMGACFFVSREIFEKFNRFDERFFIYFEEVDFCKKVIDNGLKVYFCHEAKIYHYEGTSCENEKSIIKIVKIFQESRLKYFEKHYGLKGKIVIKIFNKIESIVKGAYFFANYKITDDKYFRKKATGYWNTLIKGDE